jgi:biotin carboxyl carrier protein
LAEKYLIRDGGDDSAFELDREGEVARVRRGDGAWRTVQLQRIGESDLYLLMVDSHPVELYMQRRRAGASVTIGRHTFDYDVERWRPSSGQRTRAAAGSGGHRIVAPMTGSIVEVRCAAGAAVAAGEVVLVIESMKMNNELRSPSTGVVESVPVVAGQRVKAGELLVALKPAEG